MNVTAVIINGIAVAGLLVAFIKNRKKAIQSLKMALKSFIKILPMVFIIIIAIGLLLGFVPPEQISRFVGDQSGAGGVLLVGIVGAIMYIPALLAFPLAASILENGASVAAVAAFITTLTMIGMITLPLEIKILGKKMALLRNGISFVIAILMLLLWGWFYETRRRANKTEEENDTRLVFPRHYYCYCCSSSICFPRKN